MLFRSDAIAPVCERLAAEMERQLGRDWLDHWQTGLPTVLPGDVYPYHVLRLDNLYRAFDMLAYGKMRYNLLGSGGHWFPGNKVDALDWDRVDEALADSPVAETVRERLQAAHQTFNAADKKRLSESGEE